MKTFETLTKSEIKRINKASNGKVGEYYSRPATVDGFYDVVASVFDNEFESIIATVRMSVCLFDRRRSFVYSVSKA